MQITLNSLQGNQTEDNRDVIGYAHSQSGQTTLFLVLDGDTNTPTSGEFCRRLSMLILEKFKNFTAAELADDGALLKALEASRRNLCREFVCDYASIILVMVTGENLLTISLGDCCLGVLDGHSKVNWITEVNTLAGVLDARDISQVKSHDRRHVLTRCFRAKRFIKPRVDLFNIEPFQSLVIATDGFWSLDESTQFSLLMGKISNIETSDDVSYILVDRRPVEVFD